jgi:formamidopyrimidine-DNA glycosylase
MPELPEVEVLVRHLEPLLRNKTIRDVQVRRAKVLAPTSITEFGRKLRGAKFVSLTRRGKYLVFTLAIGRRKEPVRLVGHLGMTGRMYLLPAKASLPKHAAVVLELGRTKFVFEDTRYFGRLTLDVSALERLGPEPLDGRFTIQEFGAGLKRSGQAIKIKLLDQSLVAGVGNIYASEALFRAGVSPRRAARRLRPEQIERLWNAIREILAEAIECGSTVPLDYAGVGVRDGLFYFGRAPETPDYYAERLRVYDRAGKPCVTCRTVIKRLAQGARSTFYCPVCQSERKSNENNERGPKSI